MKPITFDAIRTNSADHQRHLNARQRWFSLAEFVVGVAIVIAHNVYHRVPNEVPILFLLGWISIRLRDGGWKQVGLKRPVNRLDRWVACRIWSHRCKHWRNAGWEQLPRRTLYGEYGLVNLVRLIPSLASRKFESS